MKYVHLGKTGVQLSKLCLGTMTFGNEADAATSRAIMVRSLDFGINFFDAAYNYNQGETERIVGPGACGNHRAVP